MILIFIFTPWRPRAAAELNTFAFVPLRFVHLPAIGHRRLALTERWIKRDTRAGEGSRRDGLEGCGELDVTSRRVCLRIRT